MHRTNHDALPAMSYTSVEPKPGVPIRPTDEAIRARAHEIWLAREGAPGNPTLDWLEAEMELVAELRTGAPTRAGKKPPARARVAAQIESRPDAPRSFAREDAPRARSRAA